MKMTDLLMSSKELKSEEPKAEDPSPSEEFRVSNCGTELQTVWKGDGVVLITLKSLGFKRGATVKDFLERASRRGLRPHSEGGETCFGTNLLTQIAEEISSNGDHGKGFFARVAVEDLTSYSIPCVGLTPEGPKVSLSHGSLEGYVFQPESQWLFLTEGIVEGVETPPQNTDR